MASPTQEPALNIYTAATSSQNTATFQKKAAALITITAFTTLSALITIVTFIVLIDAA
jgi:purine-cytosine permease-like protein